LPVGISFFTFQTLSYVIDVYRDRIKLCGHLPTFLLYIAFFPQLVAGPIVRASEFLPQLNRPVILRKENMILGLQIFLAGLIQKHLIADNLSGYVDSVFQNPELYSSLTLWIAMFAYAMQIFCDFSGYTLMAIGCGRIFGFRLPTNFRMPYVSTSVTEFWRRWHMTLSFWLRDYLYISLGGNRKGRIRTDINLMLTMLLGGLWHGASWNFVLWGGLHGGALVAHKLFMQYFGEADADNVLRKWSGWILTFLFVCFTWIPFRATDFSTTVQYYSGLLGGGTHVHWLSPEVLVILVVSVVWHILYVRGANTIFELPTLDIFKPKPLLAITSSLLLLLLFGPVGTSPFIYFQF
jgi:alginate O-acetyltransferase complex protein AlgI